MSEPETTSTNGAGGVPTGEDRRRRIRNGVDEILEALTPPESANKHFRCARIEFLRGLRELIDYRIEHLSHQNQPQGSRIPVE